MNVTTDDIRALKPGTVKPFLCENAKALYSACSLISILKNRGLPQGVVNYETQKFFESNILLVHAMGEGEQPFLNK